MMSSAANSRASVWLVLALIVALGLTGWRAFHVVSSPAAADPLQGASPLEVRLTGLMETVLGEGHVRVHHAPRPDGSQSFLVLINEPATRIAANDEYVTSLLSSAVFIDPLAGDGVTINRLAFAEGPAGGLSPARALELAAMFALCVFIAAATLSTALPARRETNAPRRTEAPPEPLPLSGPAPSPSPDASLLVKRISEDPAGAARIVRRWMSDGRVQP